MYIKLLIVITAQYEDDDDDKDDKETRSYGTETENIKHGLETATGLKNLTSPTPVLFPVYINVYKRLGLCFQKCVCTHSSNPEASRPIDRDHNPQDRISSTIGVETFRLVL